MKSSQSNLEKRGFITKDSLESYINFKNEKLIYLLNSEKAKERTASVATLSNREEYNNQDLIKLILEKLITEKALYTKIEMCTFLEKGNINTAKEMIKYLGVIGKNQYKTIPNEVSKKYSYPLPRDIIARALSNMTPNILPTLFTALQNESYEKITQLIDAIGFLLFYNQSYINENYYSLIIEFIKKYNDDDLIIYKSICVLSAFKNTKTINYLKQFIKETRSEIIKKQAERSIKIINNRK